MGEGGARIIIPPLLRNKTGASEHKEGWGEEGAHSYTPPPFGTFSNYVCTQVQKQFFALKKRRLDTVTRATIATVNGDTL